MNFYIQKNNLKNNYYSAEGMCNKILKSEFSIHLFKKFDPSQIHYNLGMAIKESTTNRIDFLHFISFLFNSTYMCVKKRSQYMECPFCTIDHSDTLLSLVHQWSVFLQFFKKEFVSFLNSFFQVDLVHAQIVLTRLKSHIETSDGTTGMDVNQFILEEIKRINRNNVSYRGIVYGTNNNGEEQLFLAENIVFDYKNLGKTIFILPYSVNSVYNPQHWCVIMVDFTTMSIFFYNSLAKRRQTPNSFLQFLKVCIQKETHLSLTICVNTVRHQKDGKLCGIYITEFTSKMIQCEDDKRVDLFWAYFNEQESLDDSMMEKYQLKFISELKCARKNKNNMDGFLQCGSLFFKQ